MMRWHPIEMCDRWHNDGSIDGCHLAVIVAAQAVCSKNEIARLHDCACAFLQLVLIDNSSFMPRAFQGKDTYQAPEGTYPILPF